MRKARARQRYLRRFVPSLWIVATTAGCSLSIGQLTMLGPSERDDSRIHAVCTTGMVADLVREIGGEHVRVKQLMREGIDPHTYKACMGDIHALAGADVVFYSGLHLEGKLTETLERLSRHKYVVAVTDVLDPEVLLSEQEGVVDPHVWFDVSLWSQTAEPVAQALSKLDPENADLYRERAELYRGRLLTLHEEVRQRIATIPKEQRVLVTAHDAFHYFERAYDIEVQAIQGISTESEAGLHEINELVRYIADRGVKAVFVENTIDESNIRSLIEGCAAKGHRVRVGGELYSDSLGKVGTPEGTYVGMVQHNVDVIAGALQ